MKNSTRWILFLGGIVVLILGVHYIVVPLWPSYPVMGWGYHHFGPRTFPWGFFIGLLGIIGMDSFCTSFSSLHPALNQQRKKRFSAHTAAGSLSEVNRLQGYAPKILAKRKCKR